MGNNYSKIEEAWKPFLLEDANRFVGRVYTPRTRMRRIWPFPKRDTWNVTLTFDLERDWPGMPVEVTISAKKGADIDVDWNRGSSLSQVTPPGQSVSGRDHNGRRAREEISASFDGRAAQLRTAKP